MTQVTVDTAFEVLSNSRRRFIIATLRQRETPVSITTLANAIGAHEAGVSPDDLSSAEQKRVYISLYQSHVPKLESAGFVVFDSDTGTVSGTGATEEIDRYLDTNQPVVQWGRLTGMLSVGSLTLVAGSVYEVPLLTELSPTELFVGVVLALLSVTVAQYADQWRRRNTRPPELQTP